MHEFNSINLIFQKEVDHVTLIDNLESLLFFTNATKNCTMLLSQLILSLLQFIYPQIKWTLDRSLTCYEYVNRLRGMSKTCEFGDFKDNLIRDGIVLGTKYHSVRGRLLTEEELTLEKSISICRSYELAQKQMKQIEKPETDQAYRIERRSVKPQRFKSLNSRSDPEKNWKKCTFCGTRHAQDKQKCPAFQAECHNCHKKNHFARMCRNRPLSSKVNTVDEEDDFTTYKIEQIGSLGEQRGKKKWFASLKINIP